ncbi:hypothetical protein BN1708_013864 [Verticillium longisporum]|uniref:Uncharacterized protein n=2 Tax=Verticillium longisporum TaxID=100787 RepID=A0A0G4LQ60_VERLO|nr:hypothetical protein BN1708_013864 [Verticillium longisporum]
MPSNRSHNPSLYESVMVIPGLERAMMPRSPPQAKHPKPARQNNAAAAAAMASQTTLVSETPDGPLGKQLTGDSRKNAGSTAEDRPNLLKRLLRKASS